MSSTANSTYQVIFTGEIAEGELLEDVKKKLMITFRMKTDRIEKLFLGQPVVLKKNLDYESALKYKSKFEKTGTICFIAKKQDAININKYNLPVPGTEEFNKMRDQFLTTGGKIIESFYKSEPNKKNKTFWNNVKNIFRG